MLPQEILSELFSIKNRVSDTILEHITDEFWKYRLRIIRIDNCDVYVYIDFEGQNGIVGELKIDRFQKRFEISAKNDGGTFMPISGDWMTISEYLLLIERTID